MMENRLPLTPPDKSRNTPRRYPRLLYSRDSPQEDQEIPQEYHILKSNKAEVKNKVEEPYVIDDDPCKVKKMCPEIGTNPGNTRDIQSNDKSEGKEERDKKFKGDKFPPEISTDPRDTRRKIKSQEEEERRMKSKRKILEIGMDGRYRWYDMEKNPDGEIVDDDITAYVAKEKATTTNLQPLRCKEDKPYSCPECGKRFTHEKYLIIHYRSHSGEKPFFCNECGKCFPYRSSLDKHKVTHTAVGAFPCPECGKRFRAGWILAAHRRVHSNDNGHR
ncbi:uncharacterized protein [Pyxicephalus adspersus]|uniref:uncharacterized protein isoform X2 n=1 Tax=Pyxicephalus adspersus TaxID=30357 RepID=UPI003B5C75E3